MDIEAKNLIELLNKLLEENGKSIESLDQLSDFNYIEDLIKIM